MPGQTTTIGLLFMTGLLSGLSASCMRLLRTAVLKSYRPIAHESAIIEEQLHDGIEIDPVDKYATLCQARVMDPACIALACYHCILEHCSATDLVKAARAQAETGDNLELLLLVEAEAVILEKEQMYGTSEGVVICGGNMFSQRWIDMLVSSMVSCMQARLEMLVSDSRPFAPSLTNARRLVKQARSRHGEFYEDIRHFLNEMMKAAF